MTREQIIESCRIGREKASQPGFAQTPVNPKHLQRLQELKDRAIYQKNNFGQLD